MPKLTLKNPLIDEPKMGEIEKNKVISLQFDCKDATSEQQDAFFKAFIKALELQAIPGLNPVYEPTSGTLSFGVDALTIFNRVEKVFKSLNTFITGKGKEFTFTVDKEGLDKFKQSIKDTQVSMEEAKEENVDEMLAKQKAKDEQDEAERQAKLKEQKDKAQAVST